MAIDDLLQDRATSAGSSSLAFQQLSCMGQGHCKLQEKIQ